MGIYFLSIKDKEISSQKSEDSREMKVLLTLKVSRRVASRKGVSGNRWSEVSGTANVGMYEQESHKRHG